MSEKFFDKWPPNEATRRQLVAVIAIDCIRQCNALQLPRIEYDRHLRAMLRSRLSETGQQELPV